MYALLDHCSRPPTVGLIMLNSDADPALPINGSSAEIPWLYRKTVADCYRRTIIALLENIDLLQISRMLLIAAKKVQEAGF